MVPYISQGIAKNKLEGVLSHEESKLKTYCYILRPLAAIRFIQIHGSIPHMEYRRHLEAINIAGQVKDEIERLLEQKRTALEGDTIPSNTVLIDYFTAECEQAEEWLSTTHFEKNRNYALAEVYFRQILRTVWL